MDFVTRPTLEPPIRERQHRRAAHPRNLGVAVLVIAGTLKNGTSTPSRYAKSGAYQMTNPSSGP